MNATPSISRTDFLIREALALTGAHSLHDLCADCAEEFRRLRKVRRREWNPEDPALLANRASELLSQIGNTYELNWTNRRYRYRIMRKRFS